MDERIEKWLVDILSAMDEIESFTKTTEPRSFGLYKNNLIVKRAVERNLEIIGEAMNRIIKAEFAISEYVPESKSIINLRNHIIHAYDNISDEIIYSIVTAHLPKLRVQIEELLNLE
ncbi:MAG: HepT-like ribonuclease domain-containing protein [Bacteroidia bacterium]